MHSEEWFLAEIAKDSIDKASLLRWLRTLHAEGAQTQADSSAEVLQENLLNREDLDGALAVLEMRASWHSGELGTVQLCQDAAQNMLGHMPEIRAMIANVGFDDELVTATESIRRLRTLRRLEDDLLVYDRTWGAGIVQDVDFFYKKVEIDFDRKVGHELSFSYASETLQILNEDHLYSRRYHDKAALDQLILDDPAEVLRCVLRSFGDMSAPFLQERLVPIFVTEAGWKKMWEKARKVLKADPFVDVPKRRNDPIRLLEEEQGYNERWFKELAADRTMTSIMEKVGDLLAEHGCDEVSDENIRMIGDRLAFVVSGAGRRQPGMCARALLFAADFSVPEDVIDVRAAMQKMLTATEFLTTVKDLPAKDLPRLMQRVKSVDPVAFCDMLIDNIEMLEMSVLNAAMDLLLSEDYDVQSRQTVRKLTVETQVADVELLYWLCRHPDIMSTWELGGLPDLARWVLRALGNEHNGERLKTQNQLRSQFERSDWQESVLGEMSASERREFMQMVKASSAWSGVDQRAIFATIIKLYPELQEIVAQRRSNKDNGPVIAQITALRTYHARQDQLERITTVEIHEVAKEIGVARSYGDLRENFEYKAAKDKQALLMRRQAELEEMLSTVRPTDFATVQPDCVTQGTGVRITYKDNREETYFILGVWDRDEELNIISSESRMAMAMIGKNTGDDIEVSSEDGDEMLLAKITDVMALSAEVKAWILG